MNDESPTLALQLLLPPGWMALVTVRARLDVPYTVRIQFSMN
jgi:hypothetical protein